MSIRHPWRRCGRSPDPQNQGPCPPAPARTRARLAQVRGPDSRLPPQRGPWLRTGLRTLNSERNLWWLLGEGVRSPSQGQRCCQGEDKGAEANAGCIGSGKAVRGHCVNLLLNPAAGNGGVAHRQWFDVPQIEENLGLRVDGHGHEGLGVLGQAAQTTPAPGAVPGVLNFSCSRLSAVIGAGSGVDCRAHQAPAAAATTVTATQARATRSRGTGRGASSVRTRRRTSAVKPAEASTRGRRLRSRSPRLTPSESFTFVLRSSTRSGRREADSCHGGPST